MKLRHLQSSSVPCRTLLWIGDRTCEATRRTYQMAESRSSQIAYRENMPACSQRPASDVDMIVLVQTERSPIDQSVLDQLHQRHPSAQCLLIRGPLCAGIRQTTHATMANHQHDWNHAELVLSSMLSGNSSDAENTQSKTRSMIAVIATDFAAAEPLLEIADQCNCSAVWCRQPSPAVVRGVDVVWWDESYADSVGNSQSAKEWEQRVGEMGPKPARHVWITNRANETSINQAKNAGVNWVLSKPYPIDLLRRSIVASPEAALGDFVGDGVGDGVATKAA